MPLYIFYKIIVLYLKYKYKEDIIECIIEF